MPGPVCSRSSRMPVLVAGAKKLGKVIEIGVGPI